LLFVTDDTVLAVTNIILPAPLIMSRFATTKAALMIPIRAGLFLNLALDVLNSTILRGMNEIQNFTEMILGDNSQLIMNSIDGTMDILSTVLDIMRGTNFFKSFKKFYLFY
jgi:hypothetical protein